MHFIRAIGLLILSALTFSLFSLHPATAQNSTSIYDANQIAPRCNALSQTLQNRFGYPILLNGACSLEAKLSKSAPKAQKTTKTAAPIIIDGIDFGDDSSSWAKDGECDDPRFEGENMAVELVDDDIGRDATDCSALYQDGLIYVKPDPSDVAASINFGDNSSEWANDGECDDPRFEGAGSAETLLDEDMGHDANDCRDLFLSGDVIFLGEDPNLQNVSYDGIDFGNNSSEWSNDGECDDPRFSGNGMATTLLDDDLGRDANDCLTLYQQGNIVLAGTSSGGMSAIDFGDDSSEWSNDGECDDPRFEGNGVAAILLDEDMGHDATDCRTLYEAGAITLIGETGSTSMSSDAIDFGDNSSSWANDGECDDPRFEGEGVAATLLDEDMGHDANDCRALYEAGQIQLSGYVSDNVDYTFDGIDFGDNSSEWSYDGECDDPRFEGNGMAEGLEVANIGRDAADCLALFEVGVIFLQDGAGQMTVSVGDINFGDDTSEWANDGQCDDSRFEGEGAFDTGTDDHIGKDATDCRVNYERGDITLKAGADAEQTSMTSQMATEQMGGTHPSGIDFGDNDSLWANDGECDDPRFTGEGMASLPDQAYMFHDAADCIAAFEAGTISEI